MEDNTTTFHFNDYSWNREANMLYIEMPAGVGYSYCGRNYECNFNDENSAQDNLQALLNFFVKFPEYINNELYISGESYAGVYVPYLAYEIDLYNSNKANKQKLNL